MLDGTPPNDQHKNTVRQMLSLEARRSRWKLTEEDFKTIRRPEAYAQSSVELNW